MRQTALLTGHMLVWTLVLVLLVSGPSLAASISWRGEFNVDGEWESGFAAPAEAKLFGPFAMAADVGLSVTLAEDKGLWDASLGVAGLLGSTPSLGRYIVNLNAARFQTTVWGNYGAGNIGHKGDPFAFIRLAGTNPGGAPQVRLTSEAGGFALTAQVPGSGGQFALHGVTDVDGFTLGGTLEHNFETDAGAGDDFNRFAAYGGASFGNVDLDAAFAVTTKASVENSAFGVGLEAELTENLNVSLSHRAIGNNFRPAASGYDVGATFTQGLLRLSADYGVNTDLDTREAAAGVTYRGSADNLAFNNLFHPVHYPNNVAFAFGGSYTVSDGAGDADSTLSVKATGPVMPDQFWVNASLTLAQKEDGFEQGDYVTQSYAALVIDGHLLVGDKVTLEPHLSSRQWREAFQEGGPGAAGVDAQADEDKFGDVSSLTMRLGATYALGDAASLRAEIGQTSFSGTGDFAEPSVNRFSSFGLTVEF